LRYEEAKRIRFGLSRSGNLGICQERGGAESHAIASRSQILRTEGSGRTRCLLAEPPCSDDRL